MFYLATCPQAAAIAVVTRKATKPPASQPTRQWTKKSIQRSFNPVESNAVCETGVNESSNLWRMTVGLSSVPLRRSLQTFYNRPTIGEWLANSLSRSFLYLPLFLMVAIVREVKLFFPLVPTTLLHSMRNVHGQRWRLWRHRCIGKSNERSLPTAPTGLPQLLMGACEPAAATTTAGPTPEAI